MFWCPLLLIKHRTHSIVHEQQHLVVLAGRVGACLPAAREPVLEGIPEGPAEASARRYIGRLQVGQGSGEQHTSHLPVQTRHGVFAVASSI
jgi:hypothetical protein